MESAIYLSLTVLVLVGAPLWIFRHDIAAHRRGISYMEHLQERIDKLNHQLVADEIKKASFLHPRPVSLRRRAWNAAIFSLVYLAIALVSLPFIGSHPWLRHIVAINLGAGVFSLAIAAWFGYSSRAHRTLLGQK